MKYDKVDSSNINSNRWDARVIKHSDSPDKKGNVFTKFSRSNKQCIQFLK